MKFADVKNETRTKLLRARAKGCKTPRVIVIIMQQRGGGSINGATLSDIEKSSAESASSQRAHRYDGSGIFSHREPVGVFYGYCAAGQSVLPPRMGFSFEIKGRVCSGSISGGHCFRVEKRKHRLGINCAWRIRFFACLYL